MCFPPGVRSSAVSAVALLVCSGLTAGQTPPGTGSSDPVWGDRRATARDPPASETGLVFVEVVATDDEQKPVAGLTAEDFLVSEDGLSRSVQSFRAVDLSAAGAADTPGSRAPRVSANTRERSGEPRRTFVVVFDGAHLRPASAARARATATRFVTEQTRPGDRVLLVAPEDGLVRSAVLPDGRASLVAALDELRALREAAPRLTDHEAILVVEKHDLAAEARVLERLRSAGPLAAEGRGDGPALTAGALRSDALESLRAEARRVLERSRDRRRRLLQSTAAVLEVITTDGTRKSVLLLSEGFLYEAGDPLLSELIAASQRANAAVDFLDAGGAEPGLGGERAPVAGPSAGAELLASVTGGSVVRGVAEGASLARLSQAASHHYILGYLPALESGGPRLRRIDVAARRSDVSVRSRRGYWYPSPARAGPDRAPLDPPLASALASARPLRDIPLRVTAVPLAPAENGAVEVAVVFEAQLGALSLELERDGSRSGELDVVLDVRHAQPGASRLTGPEAFPVYLNGGASEEAWLPIRRRVVLPPGPSRIEVVVRDRRSGAIGSVAHPFEVPDPATLRTWSLILSDIPGGDGLKPRIVARRSFAPGSVLYCYLEVFPGSGDRSPTPAGGDSAFRVVDRRGATRAGGALPLPVRGDAGRLARVLEVPLARLEPGEYELVLDLAGDTREGATELREPFSVSPPASFDDALYRGALAAYLEDDFERAGAALLRWPPEEVRAAARRIPDAADDLRQAALLLHTELAIMLQQHRLGERAERHLDIAHALVEGEGHAELRSDWLLAAAYAHQQQGLPAQALDLYTECARAFPQRGEARLGAGTLQEHYAFLPDGLGRFNLNLAPGKAVRAAERSYREALRVEPELSEARLRLARVLQQKGRLDAAVEELERVLESSRDAALVALAHLFRGEVAAARGDAGAAVAHYRAALAAEPALQVAALSLAQALYPKQGRQAAAGVLVPALGAEGATSPWLAYRRGPLRLSVPLLDEMHARVRAAARPPG